MSLDKLNIVILAAGKGTRMNSAKAKVLHFMAGEPLLQHVINTSRQLNPQKTVVVYGYGGEAVPKAFAHENIVWVEQREQLGTGHAVQQALSHLDSDAKTLILLGDVPLVSAEVCKNLLEKTKKLGLLTVKKADPSGYGRIVRDSAGKVSAIVEHKDATSQQLEINEVNTGIIAVSNAHLTAWLKRLTNDNAQREYYLTDIVAMAVQDGLTVATEVAQNESSVAGVNSKQDLASLERVYQLHQAVRLMQAGASLQDPFRIDVRGEMEVGQDVEIDVGCVFEGKVSLADNVKIGAYCVIKDATVGAGTIVQPFSHMEQVTIGKDCRIGPYARLRPGSELATETHIGNFVEIKNSQVGTGSKINHLSYVGDTTVGKEVNIGAGTITCNYDGANKHRTVIGDNAFIGSNTQLVAPVTVGEGATIAAGSTITTDAPAGELTIARGRQTTVKGWKRPMKVKK